MQWVKLFHYSKIITISPSHTPVLKEYVKKTSYGIRPLDIFVAGKYLNHVFLVALTSNCLWKSEIFNED